MICPICKREFEPKVGCYQKYCGVECNVAATSLVRKMPREYEFDCAECGKRVKVSPFGDHRMKFCGRECSKRFHIRRLLEKRRREQNELGRT